MAAFGAIVPCIAGCQKQNAKFSRVKIGGNMKRDRFVVLRLRYEGWSSLRVLEYSLFTKNETRLVAKLRKRLLSGANSVNGAARRYLRRVSEYGGKTSEERRNREEYLLQFHGSVFGLVFAKYLKSKDDCLHLLGNLIRFKGVDNLIRSETDGVGLLKLLVQG